MGRSVKKGPYVDEKLAKKVSRMDQSGKREPIKTWARASVVLPEFVGHTFSIHNGIRFIAVYITESMVGHKLGEFAATRNFRVHGGRKAEKPEEKGSK